MVTGDATEVDLAALKLFQLVCSPVTSTYSFNCFTLDPPVLSISNYLWWLSEIFKVSHPLQNCHLKILRGYFHLLHLLIPFSFVQDLPTYTSALQLDLFLPFLLFTSLLIRIYQKMIVSGYFHSISDLLIAITFMFVAWPL